MAAVPSTFLFYILRAGATIGITKPLILFCYTSKQVVYFREDGIAAEEIWLESGGEGKRGGLTENKGSVSRPLL